ncbi:Flp family type IVb pilin [Acetobacter peroxydans]|uniref:Pilus assembly protein n=1 Tax=Acetobacter peroxydans TaxID=104098 RepID=A0A4Y3TV64_9PROT|nr:Flp family type IVb pilin [Acetobacter peroxydans]NHO16192.1 Flp family type IVb pilin [Acetobacter peroxydans]GBR34197.1 hypothetical protein AA13755_0783 [Acetobacter peroxydans NBRC 13755]GBR40648.1 hypothetical protein AA0475_0729 [Acetobacter peroxydans]GEB85683.1 hypothetical protein APE01nite_14800 [Acetobacter peroxydans]
MILQRIKEKSGTTAIEYAILALLISTGIMTTVSLVGFNVEKTFCTISTVLNGGESANCGIPKNVDMSYVDPSLGGTSNKGHSSNFASEATPTYLAEDVNKDLTIANNLSMALQSLNAKDPIVGVYGLYDGNQNLVSTYQDAVNTLGYTTKTDNNSWEDGRFAYTLGGDGAPYFQVATASGAVYNAQRIDWTTGSELVDVSNPDQVYASTADLPTGN